MQINGLDRMLLSIAPKYALGRIRARAMALRHFEAASIGRRTAGWRKSSGDANTENGPSLAKLREHARDLIRNNAWARNGQRVIGRNTIGWGIMPKPATQDRELSAASIDIFKKWGGTVECDTEGRSTFFGLQRQMIDTISESGEVLIRRRPRRPVDGLSIPMQLQVLEPDFIDTSKDGIDGPKGPIVQGVEYSLFGKRVAYWLYEQHPGSGTARGLESKRVSIEHLIHMFKIERPGQVRGTSWFAPAIVTLKDLDEYEDATLMRQKIAALFSAFVTDMEGDAESTGSQDVEDEKLEELSPGFVSYLKPGRSVEFSNPPLVNDYQNFTATNLRRVAAGLGVPYEELTGDYSQVNFSSARMARVAHYANVHDWRWNMIVPQFCDPVWKWAMEAAFLDGTVSQPVGATWTPPPMAMLEPDKEGLAYQRLLRIGAITHDGMVREQGNDPDQHWKEYAEGLSRFDLLKIVLDSDPRKTSNAGLTQQRAGLASPAKTTEEEPVDEEPTGSSEDQEKT